MDSAWIPPHECRSQISLSLSASETNDDSDKSGL